MPEPRTVGFLPECLLICSCAVQQMGLGNSPLGKQWISGRPPVPSNCFILLQEEKKKKKSPNPTTMMGFKQKCGRNTLSKMALSFPFRLQLICLFLKFLLKILDALKSWTPHMQILSLLNCFPSVLKFKFLESSPYYYLKYIFPYIICFLLHFRCKESHSTSV